MYLNLSADKKFKGEPPKFPCWYDMCPVLVIIEVIQVFLFICIDIQVYTNKNSTHDYFAVCYECMMYFSHY